MPLPLDFESTPWLESPLRTRFGSILHAGSLRGSQGIRPDRMRIMGSYALVILLRGSGGYRDARGHNIPLKSGHAIHVFPDLAHTYGPSSPEADWNEVYVVYEGPVFSTLRDCSQLSADRPIAQVNDSVRIYERLKEIFEQPHLGVEGYAVQAVGAFLSLLLEVSAHPDTSGTATEDDRIRAAMRQLASPGDGGWHSANEVAVRVGLTYETFRKRFRRSVGIPPARYQMQKKIERACATLYQGAPSLKQLAADLGFFDEFHFSKAFRQVVGQSPSAYRKRLVGE